MSKDPQKVRAGYLSADKRWGPPRRLWIGDLSDHERRAIVALIDALRAVRALAEKRP